MKKSYYLLFVVVFTACNNETKNENTSVAKIAAPKIDVASESEGSGCSGMILFRKGAVIESTSFDAAGKQTTQQSSTVTDVTEENGITIATLSAQSSTAGSKVNSLSYKCDGKNIYMDLGSVMQNYAVLKDAKTDTKSLSFPIDVKEGETLPEYSVSIAMDRGPVKMTIKTTYKNRLVGPKEKITTSAGSWDCYKINADIVSEVEGPDEKTKQIMQSVQNGMKMKMVFYYAPDFGFPKMEVYRNDKLFSYTTTTKIK